ncbi:orotidine-5'-phosphate decarboxylase [Rhodococcus marinonascens]|uniref:orotidine-5'-phosphate decarboxylase n=1 Tax=Rhodococcus marinonascens TaxID=38311 RepID=UPI0009FDAB24|nr:orotidine-5'-phosphate decarboxylase [Rhodococcus marinonascens]
MSGHHHPWVHRLTAAVEHRGRLCVGIDPHPVLLESWGLPATVEGLEAFAEICVEAFVGEVAVVKPQVAFFEAYGSAGYAVLERTISVLRAAGTLVVADAKRGDIGSTMAAYARSWLGAESALSSDALTVSPYLGFGALDPALSHAAEHGRGLFVLARTSNPEGGDLQAAQSASGVSVAQSMVDAAVRRNAAEPGLVGLVVGATRGHGLDLSNFSGPILAPGLGAQGATAADLPDIFPESRTLLLPNSSRGILRHGPSITALREAALEVRDEIESALT